MKVEASALRVADVVRVPGGEREVARVRVEGGDVLVWFRGDERSADDDDPNTDVPPAEPEPSMVFDATRTLEVKRPGDLFGKVKDAIGSAFRFKAPLAPRQTKVVDALVGLGWIFHADPKGADHLHDALDLVRVEFQGDRVVLFVQERTTQGWTWPATGLVLGTLDTFMADFENQIAKLQTTSILAQWDREAVEPKRPKAPVPDASTLPKPVRERPVIVRYSEAEGILLCGDTKTHKEVIKRLDRPYRFRYSRRLPSGCAWYVQRSRNTVHSRESLEDLVATLRDRGVPVELDYVAPRTQTADAIAEPHRSATRPALAVVGEPEPARRGPGRPADRRAQAERLRAIGRRLLTSADATIQQDRRENTPRRARIAAGIRSRAYSDQVIGGAILLAADEVEAGRLTYVARLTSRPQIDDLEDALRRARDERKRSVPGVSLDGAEPELEDVAFARFRGVRVWPHNLRRLIELAGDRINATARRNLRRIAEGPDEAIELIESKDVDPVRPLVVRKGEPGHDMLMDTLAESIAEYDRLARLGVHDTTSLRAALREYLGCCRGHQRRRSEDPIAAKKRELQFAKIPGYFPTPRSLAERMVDLAAIEPGMRVLEPSAGSGSLAAVIRDEHPDARLDVLEIHATLRELLDAQGFDVVGGDFLDYEPAGVRYDRILMNPPFEKRQDARHLAHALRLLAPGGRLVAIAAGGFGVRTDRETAALRGEIERLGGSIESIPAGAFRESGTDVATVLIVVDAPAVPKVATRPALAVVAAEPEPADADCGCKHAEAEPEAAPVRKPRAGKPVVVAAPAIVVTTPMPAAADLQLAPTSSSIDLDALREQWRAKEAERIRAPLAEWSNIPKTSCFELRDGDDTLTLCAAYQNQAIGHCPPMKREAPTFGLCQPGEPVEFFLRGKGSAGIQQVKAEARTRFARARQRRAAEPGDLGTLPRADDYDAVRDYLDRVVPSRIVFDPAVPFEAIEIRPALPTVVTAKGERRDVADVDAIRRGDQLEPAVRVGSGDRRSIAEFVAALDAGKLVAVRVGVDLGVISNVLALAQGKLDDLAKQGGSLADIHAGRVEGRSIYWMTSPQGETFGPILASGHAVGQRILAAFGRVFGATRTLRMPEGWDPTTTVEIAMVDGHGTWRDIAWDVATTELRVWGPKGWEPAELPTLPARSEWTPDRGFRDFPHVMTYTMRNALDRLPATARFRVGGAWLGHLWPSDFGNRVEFDPPTGGAIDLESIREQIGELVSRAAVLRDAKDKPGAETYASTLDKWADLERGRLKWAERWLRSQSRAASKAERDAKPRLAVAPAADDQERSMSTKKAAKTKKAAAKKADAKPKAKKAAAASASTKKKAAAKKPTAKKPDAKKPPKAVAKPKPAAEKKPPAPSPCETSDDSCDLDSWRSRIKRGDHVRFRKNSKIAATLGIKSERVFEVRCTVCRDGQRFAILDLGVGSANDVAIPAGQFAVVQRGAESIPDDVRDCVAKLAKHGAKLPPELRRVVAKLVARA
ncbi:methyltransferase [Nannocystaceae bacterium ST9]